MARALTVLSVLFLSLAVVVTPSAYVRTAESQEGNLPPPNPSCPSYNVPVRGQWYPNGTPGTVGSAGGLEPDMPIWCYTQPPAGAATRILTALGWLDTWDNNGLGVQTLRDTEYDYRVFRISDAQNPDRFRTGTFINSDHWMLDIQDISTFSLSGGILVSPNRTFQMPNGGFSVEADAAAGSDGMGGADAFYEMDISPATAPTGIQVDTLYGYGSFGGIGAVGCRLERQSDGPHAVCAMYDNTKRDAGQNCVDPAGCPLNGPGRVWETQGVGVGYTAAVVEGGTPDYLIPGTNLHMSDVWRTCAANEHDLHCRDRFRLEITKTSVHLLVNGYVVYRIDGLFAQNPHNGADNRIPDSWFQSGVRPYFSSWVNSGQHSPIRWHWNDVNVNTTTPGQSISFCLGATVPHQNTCAHNHTPGQPEVGAAVVTPLPTATVVAATPVPSDQPTSTLTATPTSTPTPTATATSTPTSTATETPTATATGAPSATLTTTPVSTDTPNPTTTAVPTATATDTPVPTETPVPTDTPVPTETSTPVPTSTPSPTATVIPTPASDCVVMVVQHGTPVASWSCDSR